MLNKVRYDQTIPFIFIIWWFGPFWRRCFVDFVDKYLFYPLEIVENGLIRDGKWLINNVRCELKLVMTKQSHLFLLFDDLNPSWDEISSILFTIDDVLVNKIGLMKMWRSDWQNRFLESIFRNTYHCGTMK